LLRSIFLILILSLSGCSENVANPTNELRIVSLLPSITSTIVALESADKIVAVSNQGLKLLKADNRDSSQLNLDNITSVGDAFTTSPELIIRANPTLILAPPYAQGKLKAVSDSGIKTVYIEQTDIATIKSTIIELGKLLKKESLASKLYQELTDKDSAITNKYKSSKSKPAVVIIDHSRIGEFYIAGRGSFHHELISMLNFTNIAEGSSAYYRISSEQLIRDKVEVIFDIAPGATAEDVVKYQDFWQQQEFYKDCQIYIITHPEAAQPGINYHNILAEMQKKCQM
jgi:iron complex transport system substrate-binding protein